MQKAKILRLHFSGTSRYGGKPLHEAIVQKCMETGIAGASVFRGLEGFGETAEIHGHHPISHDEPVIVVIVDAAERIEALLPVVEEMMDTGMIASSDVEMLRVTRANP